VNGFDKDFNFLVTQLYTEDWEELSDSASMNEEEEPYDEEKKVSDSLSKDQKIDFSTVPHSRKVFNITKMEDTQ